MYLNKVTIIGKLTRDPELRSTPTGMVVSNFSVATNRVWKDKNGAKQEESEFHNVVAFGKTAETISQYVKKGDEILVEGRLQTRKWQGKDGQEKHRTEIVCDNFQFGQKAPRGISVAELQGAATVSAQNSNSIEYPQEEINPDSIPF